MRIAVAPEAAIERGREPRPVALARHARDADLADGRRVGGARALHAREDPGGDHAGGAHAAAQPPDERAREVEDAVDEPPGGEQLRGEQEERDGEQREVADAVGEHVRDEGDRREAEPVERHHRGDDQRQADRGADREQGQQEDEGDGDQGRGLGRQIT